MFGHRQLGYEDYIEILRRRWWILLLPAIVGSVGAFLWSLTLADRYTSRTLVLVEQQKVPDSYVKSVVSGDIAMRLGTMQEQILSRTRLQPIIDKFGLFKNEKGKMATEDMVERLRKSISVTPIRSLVSSGGDELPGFTISFTAAEPRLAQQVCAEITSMFIEENLRLREQRAEGTTDFLKSELEQAKRNLDEQDAKLATFKQKYIGALPGNEQTDINMMAGFSSQLDAVTSQLNRAQQDKAYAESLLAQQISAWQLSQKAGGPQQVDNLEQQLVGLQTQLTAMQAHYTADHPDVVKLKEAIAALKKKIDDNKAFAHNETAPTQETANLPEPPQLQQLRFQIHQTGNSILEKTREQARLKQQLATYQARLTMSPVVEQQFKELTRDYQTALQFYNELLTKKSQSQMATSLERKQQGEQFRVMDPPDLPEKPSYPNRPAFAGGGVGFGLAFGIGIALLLEFWDKSLRTEDDIEHFLKLSTLATVPQLADGNGKRAGKGRPGKAKETGLGLTTNA